MPETLIPVWPLRQSRLTGHSAHGCLVHTQKWGNLCMNAACKVYTLFNKNQQGESILCGTEGERWSFVTPIGWKDYFHPPLNIKVGLNSNVWHVIKSASVLSDTVIAEWSPLIIPGCKYCIIPYWATDDTGLTHPVLNSADKKWHADACACTPCVTFHLSLNMPSSSLSRAHISMHTANHLMSHPL